MHFALMIEYMAGLLLSISDKFFIYRRFVHKILCKFKNVRRFAIFSHSLSFLYLVSMGYFFSGKRIASPAAENFLPGVFGFVVEFSIASA
ncbi:hypothetical protein BN126_2034 [Cronobacter sakazakii 680]|nr:hypothetical protein BN126_2034 [Cronobacter sakazakii 680]